MRVIIDVADTVRTVGRVALALPFHVSGTDPAATLTIVTADETVDLGWFSLQIAKRSPQIQGSVIFDPARGRRRPKPGRYEAALEVTDGTSVELAPITIQVERHECLTLSPVTGVSVDPATGNASVDVELINCGNIDVTTSLDVEWCGSKMKVSPPSITVSAWTRELVTLSFQPPGGEPPACDQPPEIESTEGPRFRKTLEPKRPPLPLAQMLLAVLAAAAVIAAVVLFNLDLEFGGDLPRPVSSVAPATGERTTDGTSAVSATTVPEPGAQDPAPPSTRPKEPAILASPGRLALAAAVGESASRDITILNLGGPAEDLALQIEPGTAGFTLGRTSCGATLSRQRPCAVAVSFAPRLEGAARANLQINVAGIAVQSVDLIGTGIVVASEFVVDRVELIFVSRLGETSQAQTLTVTNAGNVPARLEVGIDPAFSGFAVDTSDCPADLGPARSCTLAVTYTPADELDDGAVLLIFQDQAAGAAVTLMGSTEATLEVDPTELGFSGSPGIATPAQTVTITNVGGATTDLGWTFDGDPGGFAVSSTSCVAVLFPNESCQLDVVYTPGDTDAQADLIITEAGSPAAQVAITGTEIAPPQLDLTPSVALFEGNLGVPTAPIAFTVANNGGAARDLAFTVQPATAGFDIAVANQGPAFGLSRLSKAAALFAIAETTCSTDLDAASTCTIDVVFVPAGVDTSEAVLQVSATNANTARSALSGRTRSQFRSDPSQLTFAVTLGAPSEAQEVTITNTGGLSGFADLAIDQAGQEFELVSTSCGEPIPPQGSCAVFVGYAATVTARRDAQLVVSDGESVLAIPLSGAAQIGVDISAAPGALEFSTPNDRASKPQWVLVTNHGAPATHLHFSLPDGAFRVNESYCDPHLRGGAECRLSIVFDPTASPTTDGELLVWEADVVVDTVKLTGSTYAEPALATDRSSLSWGGESTSSNPQTVVITNRGGWADDLRVYIDQLGAAFHHTECPTVLDTGERCEIAVTYTGESKGAAGVLVATAGDSKVGVELHAYPPSPA